eukprot:8008674-Pyramimonas_sp.AAC.1
MLPLPGTRQVALEGEPLPRRCTARPRVSLCRPGRYVLEHSLHRHHVPKGLSLRAARSPRGCRGRMRAQPNKSRA